MKTCPIRLARFIGLLLLSCTVWIPPTFANDPVPVAPIGAIEYRGWSNAFRLQNEQIKVVIVPEIGRIAHIGFVDSDNFLRLDESLVGKTGEGRAPNEWMNYGGDWLWPVAQSRWSNFQDETWPPAPVLDGPAWSGRAWRTEDGSQHCLITRDIGAPFHVRVSRTIQLPHTNAYISVRQRIERLEPSDIPVTLWQLSQIHDAEWVVFPVEEDSHFAQGFAPIKFDIPDEKNLHRCGNTVVHDVQHGGEHKLGSDSPRAWLAALKGDVLLIVRSAPDEGKGEYPDGGCTLQLYSNSELGYAELETLSTEQALAPGEHINNTLHLSLHRLVNIPESPCALAETAQRLLGEWKPSPGPTAIREIGEETRASDEMTSP